MTEPTPETFRWHVGDPEPDADITVLYDGDGDTMARDGDGLWRYTVVRGQVVYGSDVVGYPWTDLPDEFDVTWPLTLAAASPEVQETSQ